MKTIKISEEDYQFLKECKELLNTQDNRCTANPIYCIQDVEKVKLMNKKFTDFYEAWWYLNETEVFGDPRPKMSSLKDIGGINIFGDCLDIQVVKVNPDTLEIDDDEKLNTKVQIWLECGPMIPDEHFGFIGGFISSHDIRYDCGGDTFEEAIIELANLVKENNE